jgi:hypothetical protein
LKSAVQQGSKILSGLLVAAEKRRNTREASLLLTAVAGDYNEEAESFAEVLTRISRSLNSEEERHRGTPPATRHLPTQVLLDSNPIGNFAQPDDLSLQFYLELMSDTNMNVLGDSNWTDSTSTMMISPALVDRDLAEGGIDNRSLFDQLEDNWGCD